MALGDVDYVEDLQVWCGMRFRSVFQEENVVRSPIAHHHTPKHIVRGR